MFSCSGIGAGILWLTAIVIVENHFTEHFALTHSMVSSGSNVGKMLLPPLLSFLINTYGWRGALLIESALLFHCVAAISVFISRPDQRTSGKASDRSKSCNISESAQESCTPPTHDTDNKPTTPQRNNDTLDSDNDKGCYVQIQNAPEDKASSKSEKPLEQFKSSLRSCRWLPTFPVWIVAFINLFHSFGFISISVHSVAKAEESGVDSFQASYLLSLLGVGGILGRFMNGIVVDRGWLSPIGINITMTSFICAITFIGSIIEGYVMGLILTGCLGFAFAFLFTVMPVLLKQVGGTERFSVNLGFVWTVGAIGDVGGGFLIGMTKCLLY